MFTHPSGLKHFQLRGTNVTLQDLMKLRHIAKELSLFQNKSIRNPLSGRHFSKLRGRGMEFNELRVYEAGDDIRKMDWRVTAKTGKPHTKLYHDERERPVFLVIDDRKSMHFGTQSAFKSVVAAQISAILGWSTVEHRDKLGAVLCKGSQLMDVRPQNRMKGILQIFNHLVAPSPLESCALESLLWQVKRVVKPGSLIFIISDFSDMGDGFERQCALLKKHNELICCFVYDAFEKSPPHVGRFPITDGSHKYVMNFGDPRFRDFYLGLFQERYRRLTELCEKQNIAWIEFDTKDPVGEKLRRAFSHHG